MVINLNNSFTNSFTKGMNSDTAFDQLENTQYIFGKNIRITKNLLLGDRTDDYASLHEGAITPVPKGIDVTIPNNSIFNGHEILAVDTIDNLGTIVSKDSEGYMYVFRFKLYEELLNADYDTKDMCSEFVMLFKTDEKLESSIKSVSTVLYKEMENVIKLYIATGQWPIISIRVDDAVTGYDGTSGTSNYTYKDVTLDEVISNRVIPRDPIEIDDIISGGLWASQVQYTYRYYNKYGITSKLAPLTNKILVINNNSRSTHVGNKEGTQTQVGFRLRIPNSGTITDENGKTITFERMLIYRISYITPGANGLVSLIYDGKILSTFDDSRSQGSSSIIDDESTDNTSNTVTDLSALEQLTMDEFAAMDGITIIPKVIELNLEYMFAANVIDDSTIQGVSLTDTSYNYNGNGFTPSDSDLASMDLLFGGSSADILIVQAEIPLSNVVTNSAAGEGTLPKTEGDRFSSEKIKRGDTDICYIADYLRTRNINSIKIGRDTYNDMITSSLLRSLRRGETYRYGIVYFDDKGRSTNVLSLGKVTVPKAYQKDCCPFEYKNGVCYAKPYGVRIKLPQPKFKEGTEIPNIIGCQIVRRSCEEKYLNILFLVAISKPVSQHLYADDMNRVVPQSWSEITLWESMLSDGDYTKSPYYPTGFLFSNNIVIGPGYYEWNHTDAAYYPFTQNAAKSYSRDNKWLLLLHSSEIDVRRTSFINQLQNGYNLELLYVLYDQKLEQIVDGNEHNLKPHTKSKTHDDKTDGLYLYKYGDMPYLAIWRNEVDLMSNAKETERWVFDYFSKAALNTRNSYSIRDKKDVAFAEKHIGFTNILTDGDLIVAGVKSYKNLATTVYGLLYVNWVASAKYDLRISSSIPGEDNVANISNGHTAEFISHHLDIKYRERSHLSSGYIGGGPSCILVGVDAKELGLVNSLKDFSYIDYATGTHICNIVKQSSDSFNDNDDYYGFGNYFKLKKNLDGKYQVVNKKATGIATYDDYMVVFDGDIYITPNELTTMYKTYDYNSVDTLQSTQIVNYVPLETKINTFFDYGFNYTNDKSCAMVYQVDDEEKGSQNGETHIPRSQHLYNMIYSDNDASNDVYFVSEDSISGGAGGGGTSGTGSTSGSNTPRIKNDDAETNEFKQRTFYSEPKTNGEDIDNFLIYKPASFIDVDSKYGEVTNLLTDKNNLFYWQDTAFGKFSVNERSLVNDQNGNTIMLGQAGILSRYDYISTKYGMRLYDFAVCTAENNIFWVDIKNRAIVGGSSEQAINYGEQTNVQNIINGKISLKLPKIHYDLLNNELLCQCFDKNKVGLFNDELIIFNLKYKMATSIYNRDYIDIANIKNHLYGLYFNNRTNLQGLTFSKINYITYNDVKNNIEYLTPLKVDFIVNPASSVTKVFDSQLIVPLKRLLFESSTDRSVFNKIVGSIFDFETDIVERLNMLFTSEELTADIVSTDREGNIIYNIPRYNDSLGYGNRIRGKWMRVNIEQDSIVPLLTISHVITKFRQSFS